MKRATVLVTGGNRLDTMGRVAAYCANPSKGLAANWEAASSASEEIAVGFSRAFGGLGFVMAYVKGSSAFIDTVVKEKENLATALVKHATPTSDQLEVQVIAQEAGPLEHENPARFQRFNFTHEGIASNNLIQDVLNTCSRCGLNIVAHDGILRPRIGKHFSPPPFYKQIIRGYVEIAKSRDYALTRHDLQKAFEKAGIPTAREEKGPEGLLFDPTPVAATFDPDVFEVEHDDSSRKQYAYLVLSGSDQPGMVATACEFAGSIAARRNEIIRSCSRSMGGLGVVVRAIALSDLRPGDCGVGVWFALL